MLVRLRASKRACARHVSHALCTRVSRRDLLTLAIESSCDDTSVAVLETKDRARAETSTPFATLHFHEKVTANTDAYNGIHPVVALESHQSSLAKLVQKAIVKSQQSGTHGQGQFKPDFISVTRGPGMRSNLSVGLDTAKGLALAWNIPLLGVHHMQAHALTPRLVRAISSPAADYSPNPAFPFLSLLVSGGHSMLISSTGLANHRILASTGDIALGDCLDKAARAILPPGLVTSPYGRALEKFAFPNAMADYNYVAPRTRDQELQRRTTPWGWSFGPPLSEGKGGRSSRRMEFSFSGLLTAVERFMRLRVDPATGALTKEPRSGDAISLDERKEMAREVQRVAFEHLASRVFLYLASLSPGERDQVKTLVVSGGVAANTFMRHVLRSMLDARGFTGIELCFPPVELCTDNAAMIAWAGFEMFESGWRSNLSIRPIKSWSLDPDAPDGGILGVDGWLN